MELTTDVRDARFSTQRLSRHSRSRDPTPSPQKTPYLQLVNDLTYRYPVLNYLNFFVQKKSQTRTPLYPVRCAVLEFHTDAVHRSEDNPFLCPTLSQSSLDL